MIVLTLDQREAVVDSLRAGVAIEAACKAARTTVANVRSFAADEPAWGVTFAAAEAECAKVAKAAEWQALMKHSASLVDEVAPKVAERPTVAIPHDPETGEVDDEDIPDIIEDDSPELERLRLEAAKYGPGPFGYLQMVNARCVEAGLHPMDPWWIGHARKFYASGKMIDVGRIGLRGGKSTNVCRMLVADVIYQRRQIERSQVGVCPIMSSGTAEATDRMNTIVEVLCALKIRDCSGTRSKLVRGQFRRTKAEGGAERVLLFDSQGHRVEFRVYPASKAGAVGFTGICGFCDEVDLWRDKATGANPASEVLDLLKYRYTTQPTAHLYIFSAPYGTTSAHSSRIDMGDTPLQYVARLGQRGADKDAQQRWQLVSVAGPDPRLLEASDPKSVNIPAWVTSPIVPMSRCYDLAEGDMDKMFSRYGGRPGGEAGPLTDDAFKIEGVESRYGAERQERSYR